MGHRISNSAPRAGGKMPPRGNTPALGKTPPFMAIWLIENWGSPRYRTDLVGDLVEEYRAGRSRAWCWRQALCALWLGRVEAFRSSPWVAAVKALILAFGMITLGISTMSWAESVHDEQCRPASCATDAADAAGR